MYTQDVQEKKRTIPLFRPHKRLTLFSHTHKYMHTLSITHTHTRAIAQNEFNCHQLRDCTQQYSLQYLLCYNDHFFIYLSEIYRYTWTLHSQIFHKHQPAWGLYPTVTHIWVCSKFIVASSKLFRKTHPTMHSIFQSNSLECYAQSVLTFYPLVLSDPQEGSKPPQSLYKSGLEISIQMVDTEVKPLLEYSSE